MIGSKYFYIAVILILAIFLVGCGTTAQAASPKAKAGSSDVAVATTSLPTAILLTTYSAQVQATGGVPPYKWSMAPNTKLPTGVTFDTAKGQFNGIPKQQGNFQVGLTVTDSTSQSGSNKNLTLQVMQPLSVGGGALGAATVGSVYSTTLGAIGGTAPYTWRVTAGSLPAGLGLASNGTISGTPTVAGNSSFTVAVTDSSSATGSATYSMAVISPLAVSNASLPSGTVGQAYTASMSASGGSAPYAWSIISGALPAGLTLSSSTSTISGTPTQTGTFSFTAQIQDSSSPTQSASISQNITVGPSNTNPGAITSKPVISNVAVTSITPTSAKITWTTDVASDTMAFWTGVTDDYITYGNQSAVTDTNGSTSHSVTLSGLFPGTGYWFGVRSRGLTNSVPDGAKAALWEANQSTNVFTTAAAPSSGALDLAVTLSGPHHVMQGYDVYFSTNGALTSGSGSYAYGTYKVAVTGLPSGTTVHWLSPEILKQGSVSTTAVANDTVSYYTPQASPFGLRTSASTAPGTYTLNVTFSVQGGPTYNKTWSLTVDEPNSLASAAPINIPSIPNLSTWQSQMKTYGSKWCLQQGAGYDQNVWYYDGLHVYQQIKDYTGDSATWTPCINSLLTDYRDNYVLPNAGAIPEIRMFANGLYYDYTQNGSASSQAAIGGIWNHTGMGLASFSNTYMREQSYALNTYRLGAKIGQTTGWYGPDVANLIAMAESVSDNTGNYEPFMCGLLAESLINYYEDGHQSDARIPLAIKGMADSLYANAYNKQPQQPGNFFYSAFRYKVGFDDTLGGNELRGLNLLIAPMYAWLYKYTGDSTYQVEGDNIWNAGVTADPSATIGWSGKNFSQNYKWSFEYVKWRSGN